MDVTFPYRLYADLGAVKWVGGLCDYEDRVNRTDRFNVVVSAPFPVGLGGDNTGIQRARSTSYALLGQFTLPFASIWELTLGGRLTHDRKRVFQQALHNAPAGQGLGFPFFSGSLFASGNGRASGWERSGQYV